MKLSIVLGLTFSSLLTFAFSDTINTNFCPHSVTAAVVVERVFENSKYSSQPGWKEAQKALKANPKSTFTYSLVEKRKDKCVYESRNGQTINKAYLTLVERFDEDSYDGATDTYKKDLVWAMDYSLSNSRFVSYIPVREQTRQGFVLYQNPYGLKVKVVLKGANGKNRNYDLGMVSIGLK